MILLLDDINNMTPYMIKTIAAKYSSCICVVNYENKGDRPNVISLFEYYANDGHIIVDGKEDCHKTYFLKTQIPENSQVVFYDEDKALLFNKDRDEAYIYYSYPAYERYTYRIEWLDKNGNVYRIDYYLNHSYKFYSEEYIQTENGERKVVQKRWYNVDGSIGLAWTNRTDSYLGYKKGVISEIFDDFSDFEKSVYSKLAQDNICVTSARQLYVLLGNEDAGFGNIHCIVSDYEELKQIRDVKNLYSAEIQTDVFYTDTTAGLQLQRDERFIKYSSIKEDNAVRKHSALILTSTEDVVEIERLVEEFSDITFYVAAHTDVSPRIYNLRKNPNAIVVPGLAEWDVETYMNKCNFFLDITYGDDIYEGCTRALADGLLLLGYEDTARKKIYINKDLLISAGDYDAFKRAFRRVIDDESSYNWELNIQKS